MAPTPSSKQPPRRLLDDWLSLEAQALPPTAPQVQRWEMRRAFFMGAWAINRGEA